MAEKLRNSEVDIVKEYLDDIGEHALLSKEDEYRLGKSIQAGVSAGEMICTGSAIDPADRQKLLKQIREGERAQEHMVNANLRLVVSVAKKGNDNNVQELLDNIQEGNLGLMHAVKKFDPTRGFKFSTYSTFWIKQAIQRGKRKRNLTKISEGNYGLSRSVTKFVDGYVKFHGVEPSDAQISDFFEKDIEVLKGVLAMNLHPTSLDKPYGEDESTTLADLISGDDDPEGEVIANRLSDDISSYLDQLDPVHKKVLQLRYGLEDDPNGPRTYKELGALLEVSEAKAGRIVRKAEGTLRQIMSKAGLYFAA